MSDGIRFFVNDREVCAEAPSGLPVLDFIRERAGLTGTKEGCREGDCGACTVLVGRRTDDGVAYHSVCSCLLPVGDVEGCHVVTVEGLNREVLTPVQAAMVDEGASQCGFCTPGIVVSLSSFLIETATFDPSEAVVAVEGNICRCTGYSAIRRAIDRLCRELSETIDPNEERIPALVREGVLPPAFADVAGRLQPVAASSGEDLHSGRPLVAGGTDLYVQRNAEYAELSPLLVFRSGLGGIRDEGSAVVIGAAATAEEFRRSPVIREVIPRIRDFTDLHSSQPIRRRASFAGNIVNASPIGDLTIMLLALDAEVVLATRDDTRTAKLRRFFTGYKQFDLRPSEIIEGFRFEVGRRPLAYNFEKVSKRTHLDIASVNSAFSARVEGETLVEAHISAGGVAPIPMYLEETSAFLNGRPATVATVREAAAIADREIAPISDIRGTAEYKRLLLRQLIFAHFEELFGLGEALLTEVAR